MIHQCIYPFICNIDCADGDIRLVGGTESEGTVEICYGQLWGLVAETGWDNVDAQVACHQLGYPTDSKLFLLLAQERLIKWS